MNKILLSAVLLMVVLTGCTSATEKEAAPSPTAAESATQTTFTSGINIDFSKYNNDYLTDDILQILKNSLEALINKDKEEFKQGFIDEEHAAGNMFLIETDDQYRFLNISSTQNDQADQRINIGIEYEILRNQRIEQTSFFYTFEPDNHGKWKIAIID